MQRATNSKRSIAEIALTRMCDPRLVASAEALAVRIEELEKQISMMKLGIGVSAPIQHEEKTSVPIKDIPDIKSQEPESIDEKMQPYERWQTVKERIGELKRSLSSQFNGSAAYKIGSSNFVVKMSDFFAERLKNSPSDFAILKGVLAELEGVSPSDITVSVEGVTTLKQDDISGELDNLIK